MKQIIIILGMIFILSACNQNAQIQEIPEGFHRVQVKEVIHTTSYTYILGAEGEIENWFAFPRRQVEVRSSYFYSGGFDMVDFKSRELDRTFDKVVFLEGISTEPKAIPKKSMSKPMPDKAQETGSKKNKPTKQTELKIDKVEGSITIAELYENKEQYKDKRVIIKGKVTKFSPMIMDKNWIHLEDGSNFNGLFDLTITTDEKATVGEIILIEGLINLNVDFGFGYKYDVIMQEAKQIK